MTFAVSSLNCFHDPQVLFFILFSPHHAAEKGSDKRSCWVLGCQPRSTTTRAKGGSSVSQLEWSYHNQDVRESELKGGGFSFLCVSPPPPPQTLLLEIPESRTLYFSSYLLDKTFPKNMTSSPLTHIAQAQFKTYFSFSTLVR